MSLLGGFGLGGMKAARIGDQIDAEVKGLKAVTMNTKMTLQQFDFVETQLQQFAQLLTQENPMLAQQFTNIVAQINNIQGQTVNGLNQIDQGLSSIDSMTNAIQN